MATTGLGSQIGAKKETTWGTAVTVDKFYEYDSESLSLDPDYFEGGGLRAGRTVLPSSRTRQTGRAVAGEVALPVPTKGFGFFLDQMVSGTITPVQQASTIAYKSTFNVGSSVPNKSATIQVNKPQSNSGDLAFTYPGAVMTGVSFSIEVGGGLTCSTSWMAKDETTPNTTIAGAALASASYPTGVDVWAHSDISLTINGSPAAAVTSATWGWAQPYTGADRKFLGGSGLMAQPKPNGYADMTGTLTAEFYDSTYYDLFRSGAFASLVISAIHPTAIASTYYPTLTTTMAAIQVRGSSPTVGGPDILSTSIPFVVRDDGTNAPLKIEYTDTTSTAW